MSRRDRILALDLAVNTGFCVGHPGDPRPQMGTIPLKSAATHPGSKFCSLSDWLGPMLQTLLPFRCVYEAPIMSIPKGAGNSGTLEALVGYATVVKMLCCRWDVDVVQQETSTVRKHFIGHGRHPDPKPAVMAECVRRGWEPCDHNAGDAAALWDYACAVYFPQQYRVVYVP